MGSWEGKLFISWLWKEKMQVENYRHGVVLDAGSDFCPGREKEEQGFPRQSSEQGLQPELGSKGISHPSM